MKPLLKLSVTSLLLLPTLLLAENLGRYVNPFIGTKPGAPDFIIGNSNGNVFPGAVLPHGMVQFSPDTLNPTAGGYLYTADKIQGFSLTHFSGRGMKYWMDFPILPALGPHPGDNRKPAGFSHSSETASPGYYHVELASGIVVELTATARTGFARFTFGPGQSPVLQFDTRNDSSTTKAGSLQVLSADSLSGETTAHVGGGHDLPYKLYFFARLNQPILKTELWPHQRGANLFFKPSTDGVALMKVGISFVSAEGAKANLEAENPGWDFEGIRQKAASAWEGRLSRIRVEGGTEDQKTIFYTSLYHSFLIPNLFNDVDGQYLGFDQKIHRVEKGKAQYENISAWDLHHTLIPLMAVLDPPSASDTMQSLVNMASQDLAARPKGGGLPRWQQANGNSGGMEGDDQDDVIATAYALGARNFDALKALAAMERGASVPGTTSGGVEVRPHLSEWLEKGWMTLEGSLNLEYANDDYAIAQLAQALGHREEAETYLQRSRNWENIFNADWGNGGYFVPRGVTGSFKHWFPIHCGVICGFDESNSDQYTWTLPFAFPQLIPMMGGPEVALRRLDGHFQDERGEWRLNEGPDSRYAFLGNEPESVVPYAYLFTGEPDKASAVLQAMVSRWYRNSPDGMPGNDDGGAMGSWVVWAMAGLRPLGSGTGQVALTGPMFDAVTLSLPRGINLHLRAVKESPMSSRLEKIVLNGEEIQGGIVFWADLEKGGLLEFRYR